MKVLISWSGSRSKTVATALRRWLPDIIQSIKPWMSEIDIDAGARWSREIEKELSETKFGIICLTKSNVNAPWVIFEAGALAKTVEDSFVCPYLIDMKPSDLPQGPLSQFQAKKADKENTFDLICTLNKAMCEQGLPIEQLERTFERWWPDLESTLKSLSKEESYRPVRSMDNMTSEILDLVRGISRRMESVEHIKNNYHNSSYYPVGSSSPPVFSSQNDDFGRWYSPSGQFESEKLNEKAVADAIETIIKNRSQASSASDNSDENK